MRVGLLEEGRSVAGTGGHQVGGGRLVQQATGGDRGRGVAPNIRARGRGGGLPVSRRGRENEENSPRSRRIASRGPGGEGRGRGDIARGGNILGRGRTRVRRRGVGRGRGGGRGWVDDGLDIEDDLEGERANLRPPRRSIMGEGDGEEFAQVVCRRSHSCLILVFVLFSDKNISRSSREPAWERKCTRRGKS